MEQGLWTINIRLQALTSNLFSKLAEGDLQIEIAKLTYNFIQKESVLPAHLPEM